MGPLFVLNIRKPVLFVGRGRSPLLGNKIFDSWSDVWIDHSVGFEPNPLGVIILLPRR